MDMKKASAELETLQRRTDLEKVNHENTMIIPQNR